MGFEHTKGKRVPPRNYRKKKRGNRSCNNCALLDMMGDARGRWSCRRPDGPVYRGRVQDEPTEWVCDGWKGKYYEEPEISLDTRGLVPDDSSFLFTDYEEKLFSKDNTGEA